MKCDCADKKRFSRVSSIPDGFEQVRLGKNWDEYFVCGECGSRFIIYMHGRWGIPNYMIKLSANENWEDIDLEKEKVEYIKREIPLSDIKCRIKDCNACAIVPPAGLSAKKFKYCPECFTKIKDRDKIDIIISRI